MQKQKLSMMRKWLFTIQLKRNMTKIYKNIKAKKAQYDKDKEAYGKLVAKKAEEDAAKKKYDADLNTYNVKKHSMKMTILLIKRN